jgi:hypothetical protein
LPPELPKAHEGVKKSHLHLVAALYERRCTRKRKTGGHRPPLQRDSFTASTAFRRVANPLFSEFFPSSSGKAGPFRKSGRPSRQFSQRLAAGSGGSHGHTPMSGLLRFRLLKLSIYRTGKLLSHSTQDSGYLGNLSRPSQTARPEVIHSISWC